MDYRALVKATTLVFSIIGLGIAICYAMTIAPYITLVVLLVFLIVVLIKSFYEAFKH